VNALVLGKFKPLHLGHVHVIQTALRNYDHVTVVVCGTRSDKKLYKNRIGWIENMFSYEEGRDKIKVVYFDSTHLCQSDIPSEQNTKPWVDAMQQFGPFDAIVHSAEYGTLMAEMMNIVSYAVDPERKIWKISGTQIRNDPYYYWHFIAPTAKPDLVRTVCIYGPESTGKTMMTNLLARYYFGSEFIEEQARTLLNGYPLPSDFPKIGIVQAGAMLRAKHSTANGLVLSDTDLLTTLIYQQAYYPYEDWRGLLVELEEHTKPDYYLLLLNNVPWVRDPLRDFGSAEQRQDMFDNFRKQLVSRGYPFDVVDSDNFDIRLDQAIYFVNNFLKKEFL